MSAHKCQAMTKEEVMQLINLIHANPVVLSKATNASNNQLKEAAWVTITDLFNSAVDSDPRRPEQLRLKWENLKKNARKRSSKIRNNIKAGGGKLNYIPPDEALDRVTSILVSTCDGYSVEFGSDGVVVEPEIDDEVAVDDLQTESHDPLVFPTALSPTPDASDSKHFFSSAGTKGKLKRQTIADDLKLSVIERNKAIAEYYISKRKREEEMHLIKMRILEKECKLKRQTIADDLKLSVVERRKAIAEYYISKRKREEEIHVIKTRNIKKECK